MKGEKDIRASLYQQFVGLELPLGSNLEIDIDGDTVSKSHKKNNSKNIDSSECLARVKISSSKGVMFSISFSPNKYESIVNAKEKLATKLRLWSEYEHLHSSELRESFVDSIIKKRYLH